MQHHLAKTPALAPIIMPFKGILPRIHKTAFVAPGAVIVGDVEIGPQSSVWFGCVLRGDVNCIKIGARTNIQDSTVIHVAEAGQGCYVGDNVTVGHSALLHACTIEDNALIGMRATVMDNSHIGAGSLVASGALVTPNKTVGAAEVWAGSPAKFWRAITEADTAEIQTRATQYVRLAGEYIEEASAL